MKFEVDQDVQAVAEFMQRSIPAARLIGVAAGIHALAPILWRHYGAEGVTPVVLLGCDLPTPQAASGLLPGAVCADDGSVAAVDALA